MLDVYGFLIYIRLIFFSACSAPKSPVVLFCYKDFRYHYIDGRNCRILDYEWYLDRKWSHIYKIKIELEDGEILEDISPSKLYISYDSYEDCRSYFIQDEYY